MNTDCEAPRFRRREVRPERVGPGPKGSARSTPAAYVSGPRREPALGAAATLPALLGQADGESVGDTDWGLDRGVHAGNMDLGLDRGVHVVRESEGSLVSPRPQAPGLRWDPGRSGAGRTTGSPSPAPPGLGGACSSARRTLTPRVRLAAVARGSVARRPKGRCPGPIPFRRRVVRLGRVSARSGFCPPAGRADGGRAPGRYVTRSGWALAGITGGQGEEHGPEHSRRVVRLGRVSARPGFCPPAGRAARGAGAGLLRSRSGWALAGLDG